MIIEYKKNTKFLKHLQKNNSEKVANENDKEAPKRRFIYPEKDQQLSIIWYLI